VGHNENGVKIKRMFDLRSCVRACVTEKIDEICARRKPNSCYALAHFVRLAWNVHLVQNACFF
jgi:hypothetical protein